MKISGQYNPINNCVYNVIEEQLSLEKTVSPVCLPNLDAVVRVPKELLLHWISMKLKEVSIQ